MPALRIIFMGTAELACPSLRALCLAPDSGGRAGCPPHADLQVVAVVTQPDRPKGRDLKPAFSPVKQLAVQQSLPVLQPARAREPAFLEQLASYQPELIVVAAYGQILPPALLALPRFGCINVHTSLLPKYRGAAPIQWAILNDESETGVTIMKMDAGLDTGDILTQVTTPIHPEDNAQTLHDRLAQLGAGLLVQTIPDYVPGKVTPRPQPSEGATYARKITKEDGHLDWTQPARLLWNRIRAFTPWPGAFTFVEKLGTGTACPPLPKPEMLKIWSAQIEPNRSGPPGEILQADKTGLVIACGEQALRVLELQREGARRLPTRQFLLGHPLAPGQRLS